MEIKEMNLFQKISKVMEDVEYLQKDDEVITNQKTGAGYKAVSEEKVTGEVRKALIKYGIVIIPIKQEHKREDEILKDQYGNEKMSRLTTVDTTYRIQNIDNKDDYIEAVSSGTGADTQDKGIGKAMTYSYKYLLLRAFAIPTGEDTDKVSSEEYDSQFVRKSGNTKNKIDNDYRQALINYCNENGLDMNEIAKEYKLNSKSKQEDFKAVIDKLEVK